MNSLRRSLPGNELKLYFTAASLMTWLIGTWISIDLNVLDFLREYEYYSYTIGRDLTWASVVIALLGVMFSLPRQVRTGPKAPGELG